MKQKNKIWIYQLLIFVIFFATTDSCKKDDAIIKDPIIKKDPIIVWENPGDIFIGTTLSTTQLNATADVEGAFVYTPAFGTVLSLVGNQDLKVDFTPTDVINYNTATKTVNVYVTNIAADIDGNVYTPVTIGTQVWMVENLKTTKYKDSTAIPLVVNGTAWSNLTTPGYCWYNNNESSKNTYGALYNWYTVNTKKLCPAGWHVPNDAEWTTLTTFLGGESVAGGKLKETGTKHWISPNTGATNETGFTALPGGSRYIKFADVGYYGNWWSATLYKNSAHSLLVGFGNSDVYSGSSSKELGYSVRCIRD